jgi:CrcB protein
MIQKLLLLMLAGGLGTLARFSLSEFVHRFDNSGFPSGTLVVNLLGCFIVGLIWALIEQKINVSQATRIIILIGFMGAFTTFSSYILETSQLMQNGEWLKAVLNFGLGNVGGFAALLLGISAVKAF